MQAGDIMRVPAPTPGGDDTMYKVDLRDGRSRANQLVIGDPKAPSTSNMHWSQDSIAEVKSGATTVTRAPYFIMVSALRSHTGPPPMITTSRSSMSRKIG